VKTETNFSVNYGKTEYDWGALERRGGALGVSWGKPSSADKFYRGLPAQEQRERVQRKIERKDKDRTRCRLVVEILRAHVETGAKDLHDLRRDPEEVCEGVGCVR
jgi:hypothetical protein